MKTIGMVSLGCPKNLVDSEGILADFVKNGFQVVDEPIKADVVVVNTCAFIEEAKKEYVDAILDLIQLKKEGLIKKIIVAGCLPQRYGKVLRKELGEVDVFKGVRDFKNLDIESRFQITPPHYGYIKVSEGCDNRCKYCTISKIRGHYKSKSVESILDEAKYIYGNSKGRLSEINLISQDLAYYGMDLYGQFSLVNLLSKFTEDKFLKTIKNVKWMRLLYVHPAHVTYELIETIKYNPYISKYIDLPIQHINDKILKVMGRRVTKRQILNLIDKLRKDITNIAIRTSLIVGLPGEREKEFKELLDFMKDVKFERLGIFTYSREEGTPAYNFKAQVSEKIKNERFNEAMRLQQKIAGQINIAFLGRTLEVLIDEKDPKDNNLYIGRSYADAPEVDGTIFVKSSKALKPGDFVDVRVIDTFEYDLVGERV